MKKSKFYLIIILIFILVMVSVFIYTTSIPSIKKTNNDETNNSNINKDKQQNKTSSSMSVFNVQQDLRNIAEAVIPSIVTISSKKLTNIEDPYLDTSAENLYLGSGVIVTEEGHIVTANHLIMDNERLYVYLGDNRVIIPEIVGRYEKADVALLKISPSSGEKFPVASLGDSSKIKVGDIVMAIGNPFGLKNSTTLGIVGSPSRKPKFAGSIENPDLFYIQSDALITNGNSGGALVNINGQVIGINVSVLGFGEEQSMGIGFAVPINYVERIIQNLVLNKSIDEVYTGIITSDDIAGYNKHLVIGQEYEGILIASVYYDSPAYNKGIHKGDLIISVNDNMISDGNMFHNIISGFNTGEQIKIEFERDGKRQIIQMNVAKKPIDKLYHTDYFLGMLVGGEGLNYVGLDLPDKINGVVVVGLEEDSPSAKSSIKEGDIITQIDSRPIRTIEDYNELMDKIDWNKSRYLLKVNKYKHGIEIESKSVYLENR